MPHNISHFAVHVDDISRARSFYEKVFGWKFTPWGPPDFYLIETGDDQKPGIHGSLQKRAHPVEGEGVIGFECTITVYDLEAVTEAIVSNGGSIVFPKSVIPNVGSLIQFKDTEGNIACAMHYENASDE